jgi:hypothetical protein
MRTFPRNISKSTTRSRLYSKPISSALSRKPATTASDGSDSHLRGLLMTWTCPPLQKNIPELCGKK